MAKARPDKSESAATKAGGGDSERPQPVPKPGPRAGDEPGPASATKPEWKPGQVTRQVINAARAEDLESDRIASLAAKRASARASGRATTRPGAPDPDLDRDLDPDLDPDLDAALDSDLDAVLDSGPASDRDADVVVETDLPLDAEPSPGGTAAAPASDERGTVKRGRGRPRARTVDQERALILDAARASFGDLGFTGASIDDIAKRAGIQRRSVYRQFTDKEDLFQAAMASAVDHVLGQLTRAFERNEELEPQEALFRNYRRSLELVRTDTSWALVFLSSMSSTSELSTAAVLRGRRQLESGIAASLRYRWELLGVDRPERADQLATMMVGLVMTMGTRMSLEPDLDLDDVAHLLTSFTIGGVIWIEAGQ